MCILFQSSSLLYGTRTLFRNWIKELIPVKDSGHFCTQAEKALQYSKNYTK